MPRRILLITQWFDPEPTSKGLVFARELVRRGFEVEVLTGFPNYPGGKLYAGYKVRLVQREVRDGVQVTRVALYPSHDQSGLRRTCNYLSFAATAAVYSLFFAKRPDVIYAYHPPLTVGIVAALTRLIRRVPAVLDIQDLWPDTLRATGMLANTWALALAGKICSLVYGGVDHVVVLSPGFKRMLVSRGVPDQRIDVIHNWCDEVALQASDERLPENFPTSDRFRVVFAGNMGKAQALDAVLEAAVLLRGAAPEVSLVFVGGGVEVGRLRDLARTKELRNVVFVPHVPMAEIGAVLRNAEALLVHLRKDPLFGITIPSKTQAYMAVGKPIVMAVSGDAASLIEESGCGIVAESENPASIAAAIVTLSRAERPALEGMGMSGRKFYEEHLCLRVGVTRFARIFDQVAARKAGE